MPVKRLAVTRRAPAPGPGPRAPSKQFMQNEELNKGKDRGPRTDTSCTYASAELSASPGFTRILDFGETACKVLPLMFFSVHFQWSFGVF